MGEILFLMIMLFSRMIEWCCLSVFVPSSLFDEVVWCSTMRNAAIFDRNYPQRCKFFVFSPRKVYSPRRLKAKFSINCIFPKKRTEGSGRKQIPIDRALITEPDFLLTRFWDNLPEDCIFEFVGWSSSQFLLLARIFFKKVNVFSVIL